MRLWAKRKSSGLSEDERNERRAKAMELESLARVIDERGQSIEDAREADIAVVINTIARLGGSGADVSRLAARREAMALVVQERIARELVEASDRVATVGNRLAFIGVLVMAGSLALAIVEYWRHS